MATSITLEHGGSGMNTRILPLLLLLLLVLPASAHVPGIPTGDITLVPDPEKSYAWYGTLEDTGETDQYLLQVEPGTLVWFSLSSPDEGVRPSASLALPGVIPGETLPGSQELPNEQGEILVPPVADPEISYEPFTPMALYEISSFSVTASEGGPCTIAVYGDEGRYILATGRSEAFSIVEWILIPVSVLSIRAWQGQSLLANLLVIIGTIIAGAWWYRRTLPVPRWKGAWLLAIAGFAYLGSGILVLVQMAVAGMITGPVSSMALTAIFAAIPLVLGILLVRIARTTGPAPSVRERAVMAILGLLGLLFWAGLIAGPLLAMGASVLPGKDTHPP